MDISQEVLRKLPRGKFRGVKKTQDMSGNTRTAILWSFRDPNIGDLRTSFFDVRTGEYLGESV